MKLRSSSKPRPLRIACRLLAACLFFARPASAALTSFSADIDGEPRVATLEVIPLQGVSYVSLARLIEQFGGGYNLLPTRMKVDFRGASAWVGINDNRVNALNIFSLRHPILRHQGDVLIAADDVPLFLNKAFRVRIETRKHREPPRSISIRRGRSSAFNEPVARRGRPGEPATGPEPPRARPPAIDVIVIDAGHGGYDTGLEGRGGLLEKDLTLAVALEIEAILTDRLSQRIVLTRNEDIGLTTEQRALLAANSQGKLLLSIHGGGLFSSAANGGAIFHALPKQRDPSSRFLTRATAGPADYSDQNTELARAIGHAFVKETSATLRGIQAAPCRLLERVAMPGLLIEIGCLTNPSEEALLEMDSYRAKIASGIAKGLIAYLESLGAVGRDARSAFKSPAAPAPSATYPPPTPEGGHGAQRWRSNP